MTSKFFAAIAAAAVAFAVLSQPAVADTPQGYSKSKARTADRNHAQMMAYIKS